LKWNLDFHHGSFNEGVTDISIAVTGVTVQQEITVRQPGFVTYYWSRPEFIPQLKQPYDNLNKKQINAVQLKAIPKINKQEDSRIWKTAPTMAIDCSDKTGALLTGNSAGVKVGIFENSLCFNLQADGAKIRNAVDKSHIIGTGMAAQMAGVNGVFVDQALFKNECFWIMLQPRDVNADNIHQDYYLMIVNNSGEITGTHYDQFGTPLKTWHPTTGIDLYNTASGWGAEVNLDLRIFGYFRR
jgi:hypothetical protein